MGLDSNSQDDYIGSMFNRDSAFSIEIKDPDNPNQEHNIESMLTLGDQLLIFTTTGIFRVLTADTIDPKKKHTDTRHSYEKIYSLGTSNPLIARTIIQFDEIFQLTILNAQRKNMLLDRVWDCTKLLLQCEKSHYHIYKSAMELLPVCDGIIEANKSKPNIPPLPKIPDLNAHVSDFFMNGKLLLVETYRFLNEFFEMPFENRAMAHFDRHRLWVKKNLGEQHPIHQLLSVDAKWIKMVSECSNAIRHPEDGQKLEIENITLKPGNKFSVPTWKYDLNKKGLGAQENFTDLVHDFGVYIYNMSTFFEEILLLIVQDTLKDNPILALYKKHPDHVSSDCPIMYEIGLKQPIGS